MSFVFFDREQEVTVSHRRLPHWFQVGVTYYVTFRTLDSLPATVLHRWVEERAAWLLRHGIDPTSDWESALGELSPKLQSEFHNTFGEAFHRYLDAGYGECLLKRPDLAQIVAKSLLHFDGQRYYMGDFVVMPNHVHLLVCLLGETDIKAQCKSWKKYTASAINASIGRRGHFWQPEVFDHLVRSEEQFDAIRRYIADNPIKANLRKGEYLLYQRSDLGPLKGR
jgi:REP element-mobilizing transposase RayT